ncbi:collagen-like protein [Streptococcus sp. ZJ100]|uniref:hyaluronate lyase N-terminal domain-containing protein n=1 Tax=Streptococcus handemini TaxID=3161188 RepID=UPI0032EBD6F0
MTTEKIPIRVQHKRMTASQWASSSLVLLEGEIGVESDTGFAKIGDGRSRFSALKYLSGPKGDRGERGLTGETGATGKTGPKGEKGDMGPIGPVGPQGAVGPKGADGVVSFDALTPSQKASLKGDKGDKGERGEAGPMPTITINSSGIWEINGRPTGVSGRGQAGPKGSDGAQGRQGPAGSSVTIASTTKSNGVTTVRFSTGQSISIHDGAKGDRGERGLAGAPGQHILNQKTNQPLKYWFGSKADYDRITFKDANTIYDVYE